ncbi:IclR family transcriptional regulator domain-containing protein [Streptomyces sp. 8N114]|uniref:IclR family transcriptional regulator domain-containing protein n=1 Tax=Streptomyces sp. 8N114 TaxID=3457419 RepID=UPI003FD262BA
MPQLSERSITTVPALLDDLAATRARGYSIDDEETTTGIVCLAVPVSGLRTDSTPFAVSVTVLKARLDDAFRSALPTDLQTITRGLGNPMLPVTTGQGTTTG